MMNRLSILLLLLAPWTMYAQSVDIKNAYRIEGSNIVLNLDPTWSREQQEMVLDQCGMKGLSLDTLWKFGTLGQLAKDGWKLSGTTKNGYKIYKGLTELSGNVKWNKEVVVFSDEWQQLQQQTSATFGFNSFKKQSVKVLPNGSTRFFLYGKLDSEDVYLSGTFNNWSTLKTPMVKTDSGWVANVKLRPGKHCYKFIVNGRWITDPQNTQREDDFHDGYNSVFFMPNYEFTLKGYEQAREVIVTGSFNGWNEHLTHMQKINGVWRLAVYLKDGTYGYKFIVDRKWINDPANPVVRDDGRGYKNSYLQLGEPTLFTLNGFTQSRQVILAGNFNGWNQSELKMVRTTNGWELPHVLAAGNYQYKFIVDGEWMTDPKNPHIGQLDGHKNSVSVVKSNHTFMLKAFPNAKEVHLAGNFNDWSGYTMKKVDGVWMMDIYLPPGKCLYKFIVDGKWIIDPGNELWEQNEFGNGNSVLWVAPQ